MILDLINSGSPAIFCKVHNVPFFKQEIIKKCIHIKSQVRISTTKLQWNALQKSKLDLNCDFPDGYFLSVKLVTTCKTQTIVISKTFIRMCSILWCLQQILDLVFTILCLRGKTSVTTKWKHLVIFWMKRLLLTWVERLFRSLTFPWNRI